MKHYSPNKGPNQDPALTRKRNKLYSFRSICKFLKTQRGTQSKKTGLVLICPFLEAMSLQASAFSGFTLESRVPGCPRGESLAQVPQLLSGEEGQEANSQQLHINYPVTWFSPEIRAFSIMVLPHRADKWLPSLPLSQCLPRAGPSTYCICSGP